MKIRFLTLAEQEVDDGVIWYNHQVDGLGREFLDELDRSVRLVRAYPEASTEIEPGICRWLLTRFPYSIVYGIDSVSLL